MLERHPIHQSVNRPQLLLGGDREMTIIAAMVDAACGFSLFSFWWGVVFLALWFASVLLLQRMAKADPLMRRVFWRHMKFRKFYPARSGLYSRSVQRPPSWKS